ncbi:guanylate kinase [Xylariaceae sp. FL0594]|nr:guanylate kinase [Xylariaceae sp. FL0594]
MRRCIPSPRSFFQTSTSVPKSRAIVSRFAGTMAPTASSSTTTGLPPDRRPLVISGPSGVGKGTLIKRLFAAHPDTFAFSVSHTTRAPRPGETDGVDYHYVSAAEFGRLVEADGFVEHAQFGSNRYGTSKATIREQSAKGKVVLLDIEMEGVKQIRKSDIDARFIFVKPPTFESLEQRLRGRGTEDEDSLRRRLNQARVELEYADTPGVHDVIIVNDDLDVAYKELEDFVYKPLS